MNAATTQAASEHEDALVQAIRDNAAAQAAAYALLARLQQEAVDLTRRLIDARSEDQD